MQLIDLFSGIGGFSLSGNWLGWRTIQFCENNDFCKQVLKKHWPEIPIHDDIKTLTAEHVFNNALYDSKEKTIVTAGVPCQPWSNAGKRQGESDDRNLWPETIRFIGSFRPDFAVLENVPGLLNWHRGIFFEDIYTSLETEGYEIWPFIIPSASVGAWDKRERVWIIAHNHKFKCNNDQKENRQSLSNEIQINQAQEQKWGKQQCGVMQSDSIIADINSQRLQRGNELQKPIRSMQRVKKNPNINQFNSHNAGYNSGAILQQQATKIQFNNNIVSERLQGHAGYDLSSRKAEQERLSGQANWSRPWVEVASKLCGSNARVSHRLDRIKALGNSVNPRVVFEIFKAIEKYNNLK